MRQPVLHLIWLLIPLFSGQSSFAQTAGPTPLQLIKQADQAALHQSASWRKLLFYSTSMLGGEKSIIDDEEFFISDDGAGNPREEMTEMIRSMFDQVNEYREPEDHPLCRFPARTEFLITSLNMNRQALPKPLCRARDAFLSGLNFDKVYLTFSNYNITTPSGWFGHLLIRLEQSKKTSQSPDADLAVSFIPQSSDVFLANHIANSLTGGSNGYFSILPFQARQKKIAGFEARDMWSYQLNFNSQEIKKLAEVLWELNERFIDYFYFDDNSAALAMALIEAAKPNFSLFRSLPHFWVTPVDVLKSMIATEGLVKAVRFLPSSLTRYLHRIKHLTPEEKDLISDLAELQDSKEVIKTLAAVRPDRRALVIDAFIELLEYYENKAGSFLNENYQNLRVAAEKLRTTIKEPPRPVKYEPENGAPHLAGGTARVGMFAGFTKKTKPYQLVRWRPVLRDEYDPQEGYPDGYSVNYMSTELYYRKETKKIYVTDFSLVDISSFPVSDRTIRGPAWKFQIDGRQRFDCGRTATEICTESSTMGAFGWSEVILKERYQAHAMLAMRLGLLHDGYQKYTGQPGFILGATNRFDSKTIATLSYHWRKVYTERSADTEWETDFVFAWNFFRGHSLRAEMARLSLNRPTGRIGYSVLY